VARADNLSAFYYNPAGLSKSEGPNLLLGSNIAHMTLDYRRSGDDSRTPVAEEYGLYSENPSLDHSNGAADAAAYGKVSLGKNFGPVPMLVFSWGDIFDVEGLAVAIGLMPPSGFGMPHYPEDGPQRYAITDANFLMVFPGIGVSYDINRFIQIGAVFLSGIGVFEQSLAIRPAFVGSDPDYNEDLDGDALLTLEAADYFMPTAIIGALSNPFDFLEIGVSVRLPAQVEAEGHTSIRAPTIEMENTYIVPGKNDVTLKQHFPWKISAGARYIHRRFDIETDFVWENWSSLRAFEIEMGTVLNDGNTLKEDRTPDRSDEELGDITMPDSELRKDFRDTYSIRLGSDIRVIEDWLVLRLGGFYQSSAYPKNYSTFNLDFPYGEQIGVGGGLTVSVADWLDIHAGYMHIFQFDIDVTDGAVQQQGLPLDVEWDPETGEVTRSVNIGNRINNGHYDVAINLFGLSLEGHF